MGSTTSSSDSSRSSSDTDQTVTASARARREENASGTNENASESSESLPSLPTGFGSSASSIMGDGEFTGIQTYVIPPSSDTASDNNTRPWSLASSYGTIRRSANNSRASGSQTGQDAQQPTVRHANTAAAADHGGPSGGESSRAGRERSRRARAQERVQSYLSEVSQASVLTNFEEDHGIPVPPSPPPPPFLDTIVPRNCCVRTLFWVMLVLIVLMTPIYVWMIMVMMGRA
ncbi:hypothetical protein V8F20_004800 [Naviculisporaceae sp. PSN 640]